MAGYYGWSMSNNALDCYDEGIMPLSKWNKGLIIEKVYDLIDDDIEINFDIELLKKLTTSKLKDLLLTYDSYHHTSIYFNTTDFYRVDADTIARLTNEKLIDLINKKVEKKEKEMRNAIVNFIEWSGTRKHPKANKHCEKCLIDDNWAYTSIGKKKLSSKYVSYDLI